MLKILGILTFFKTRLGIIILLTLTIFIFFFLTLDPKTPPQAKSEEKANGHFPTAGTPKEQPITTINRNTASIKTIIAPLHPHTQEIKTGKEALISNQKTLNTPPTLLSLYNNNKTTKPSLEAIQSIKNPISKKNLNPSIPKRFAPFGRLIKCELVNTLDSSNRETPIIGLVMEPVYWNGDLIIPAGSEVHGIATTNSLRERIVSGNQWNIILPREGDRPNGMTLELTAIALDRDDPTAEGKTYGITDGSFGLKGYRIKSNNLEEIKVFAATFLGAITAGLQTQVPTESLLGGTRPNNTLRDASLGGISAVMHRLAEKIEKEIEDNGFYTRVPAGKQFYLYVQQAINPEDWSLRNLATHSEESPPPGQSRHSWDENLSFLKSKLAEIEQ